MVTVTSASTTGPTLFPLAQCGSGTGDTVTLGCLATGFTPSSLTFAWSKNGASLSDSIQYPPIQKGNFYTGVSQVRVRRQDWESKQPFRCAVTHPGGNPHVDINWNPPHHHLPTLTVLASSDEGNEASFSCFAKGFSPDKYEFKWLKNEQDVTKKIFEFVTPSKATTDNGTEVYSAASFLTVQGSEWTKHTTFTCLFEGKGDRNLPVYVNSSVTYEPDTIIPPPCNEGDVDITINGPTMEDIFVKKVGHLECQVLQKTPDVLRVFWEDPQGNEILGSSKKPTNGQKKIFSATIDITYDEWSQGFVRYCVVEHSEWMEPRKTVYERTTGGQPQRPSVFMLPPLEHTRKETVTLTCFVKDFSPQEVFVSWLVDDEPAQYPYHTTKSVENHGSFSAYGQLSVTLDQWNQKDVVYSCVVYHESIANTTKAIVRSIGHRTFDRTNLVNLNMNIPETCKAQ